MSQSRILWGETLIKNKLRSFTAKVMSYSSLTKGMILI